PGLGGPSAAIVTEELLALGGRRLVRVGTCRSDLPLASLVIAETVVAEDGTSRALGAAGELAADPELLAALVAAGNGAVSGRVLTTDLYYGMAPHAEALAVDLTSGAVFAVAARHEHAHVDRHLVGARRPPVAEERSWRVAGVVRRVRRAQERVVAHAFFLAFRRRAGGGGGSSTFRRSCSRGGAEGAASSADAR